VLDTLFHALVRWLSPVLVFTSEEVWGTRLPDAGSVHLLEWPLVPQVEADETKWGDVRVIRQMVSEAIEPLRRDKVIGSSLEADVQIGATIRNQQVRAALADVDMAEIAIVSGFDWADADEIEGIAVRRTDNHKCGRCWRHLPEVREDGGLCARCDEVLNG